MSRVGVTTGQLFSTLPAARDWRDACWQKVLRSRLLTSGHHPNPDGASVSSRMTRAPNDCATRRFGPLCDERVCVRRAARRTFPAPRLTTLVWYLTLDPYFTVTRHRVSGAGRRSWRAEVTARCTDWSARIPAGSI